MHGFLIAFIVIVLAAFWCYSGEMVSFVKFHAARAADSFRGTTGLPDTTADVRDFARMVSLRQAVLRKKLPAHVSGSPRLIGTLAQESQLHIVLLEKGAWHLFDESPLQGAKKAPGAFSPGVMPIVLQVSGRYTDIILFLRRMDADCPGYVCVERMTMRATPAPGVLDVVMEFNLYAISP